VLFPRLAAGRDPPARHRPRSSPESASGVTRAQPPLSTEGLLALQRTVGNAAVSAALIQRDAGWAQRGPIPDPWGEGKNKLNSFPFGAETKEFLRDYVDERTLAAQVNLMVGRGIVTLTVEGSKDPITVPHADFDDRPIHQLVPIFPAGESLEQAKMGVDKQLLESLSQRGMTPCFFYRGAGGLIWPSLLNEQTLPRTMPVVRKGLQAEREAAAATAETFTHVLFWYVGARFPVRVGAPKPGAAAPATASAAAKLTALEGSVAGEAQAILRSKELATLRAAHAAGKSAEVVINGRTIVYAPEMNASGMTLFGENGFVIGREAFKNQTELTKTLLHELHRLATSAIKVEGAGGALVTEETAVAQGFADGLFAKGVQLGLW
jgi:hypothetical protein